MKIGKIKLKYGLLLAPMVDVTDMPFRLICREYGAELAFTEMLSPIAIERDNKKTLELMKISENEHPVGIQLCGNDIKQFEPILNKINKLDIVDLNCGCPVPNITNLGMGAALLEEPEKIKQIITYLVDNLNKPITAKIRLGISKVNAIKVSKIIEDAGASAITIHARMANHRYKTKALWDWIKKVKENISIPVIGNGDVYEGKDASDLLKFADGVMIARGAIGDPLIFKRVIHYLKTVEVNENSLD